MTLMLQKEVCDRIMAKNKSKEYGRLTVLVQALCSVEKIMNVSKESFFPSPKVDSSVIKLIPKNNRPKASVLKKIQEITNIGFSKRRKMIKSSLNNILLPEYIDKSMRVEDLSVSDFIKIAEINCDLA